MAEPKLGVAPRSAGSGVLWDVVSCPREEVSGRGENILFKLTSGKQRRESWLLAAVSG